MCCRRICTEYIHVDDNGRIGDSCHIYVYSSLSVSYCNLLRRTKQYLSFSPKKKIASYEQHEPIPHPIFNPLRSFLHFVKTDWNTVAYTSNSCNVTNTRTGFSVDMKIIQVKMVVRYGTTIQPERMLDLMGKGRLPRPRRRRVPQERRQERIDRTFVVRCKVESMFMLYPCSIESISRHVLLLL